MNTVLITLVCLISALNSYAQMEESERYQRGWMKLREIDGEVGEQVVNGLKDISPELSRFIIEYSFGDVYSLPLLDNKSKEVAAVASLTSQGAIPQLKVHLNGALNTGCSLGEVKEVILQMSVYCGFPRCINAMNVLKEVVTERTSKGIADSKGREPSKSVGERYQQGAASLATLNEEQEQILGDAFADISPILVRFIIEYGYGDVFSRDNLDVRYRQIATIAALTTLGNASSQLKFHIEAGLHIGLAHSEIAEIMLLMTVYAGFPAAINGINVLKEVVSGR